jgi:hypothetical protein
MLSLALSVATIIATGLVLGAADVPLTGSALVISLLAVTLVAVAVAVIRAPLAAAPGARIPVGALARSSWLWSALVATGVFALLVVALSRPLPNAGVAGYSELWGLRAAGGNVAVGVKNEGHSRAAYRVVASGASGGVVSVNLTLAPGREWKRLLSIGGPRLQTVDVRLYRLTDPVNVYREVTLRE